jgi:putative transposase
MKEQHPIEVMCRAFEVSPSGYYDWQRGQEHLGRRAQENDRFKEQIGRIHQDSRQTYGAPRIQVCLSRSGQKHGRNRIARLMREQGICGRQKRRFRVRTTESNHDQPIAPNRLAQ